MSVRAVFLWSLAMPEKVRIKIPARIPVSEDTIIVIDDIATVTWLGFLRDNTFEPEQVTEMRAALQDAGEYQGGGGAAAEFNLTLLTHRVNASRLQELRRIRVEESVFFENVEPETLASEVERISTEVSRSFSIGGVKLGTRIWRTA